MDKDLDFKLIGIAKAVKQERFTVPSNQREYSWLAESQVKSFLADISNAIRQPDKSYFLGTIVVTISETGQYEIADGQQRLATTTIFLAAIRDWFRAKGDTDNYKDIETSYLFTYDRKSQDIVPKLKLNVDDNEYFRTVILSANKGGKSDSHKRSNKLIGQAYDYMKNYIESIEKNNRLENAKSILNDWILYLEEKAKIILLIAANAENAFMLFETMNDRGLKTSQVDLVKNRLFQLAGDRLGEAQRLWSSMKSSLESVTDDDEMTLDFLRAVCSIMFGHTTKKDIMSRIRENTLNKTEAIKMLTLLEEFSKDFAAILNPEHPKWNRYSHDVRKSIEVINLFKASQIRPLMLAVATYFNEKNTATSFRKLVSWSVRFIIVGIRGGRLDEGYAKLANNIFKRTIKTDEHLKVESEKIIVNDAQFKTAFETATINTAKQARYFLRALEMTARGEEKPQFIPNDDPVINLEHIMPSSISDEWHQIKQQDIDAYQSRLGNMALLQADVNSNIGNQSFDKKKKVYKNSAFILTNQISDLETWDVDKIDKRQKKMAELAVKTWPL